MPSERPCRRLKRPEEGRQGPGVLRDSDQGRGAHFPGPFRTLLPNRPETAGTRAQITDLGELYPTMPSVPRETLI